MTCPHVGLQFVTLLEQLCGSGVMEWDSAVQVLSTLSVRAAAVFAVRPSPLSWPEKTAAAGFVTVVRSWWVRMCLLRAWFVDSRASCVFSARGHGSRPCAYSTSQRSPACESQAMSHLRVSDTEQEEFHNPSLLLSAWHKELLLASPFKSVFGLKSCVLPCVVSVMLNIPTVC